MSVLSVYVLQQMNAWCLQRVLHPSPVPGVTDGFEPSYG